MFNIYFFYFYVLFYPYDECTCFKMVLYINLYLCFYYQHYIIIYSVSIKCSKFRNFLIFFKKKLLDKFIIFQNYSSFKHFIKKKQDRNLNSQFILNRLWKKNVFRQEIITEAFKIAAGSKWNNLQITNLLIGTWCICFTIAVKYSNSSKI